MWRRGQLNGLQEQYKMDNNLKIRSHFHAILGLPFVSEVDVKDALEVLRNVNMAESIDHVLDLLEGTYVLGRRRGAGRILPKYPINTWNCYERTKLNIPRTNNRLNNIL